MLSEVSDAPLADGIARVREIVSAQFQTPEELRKALVAIRAAAHDALIEYQNNVTRHFADLASRQGE